MHDTSCDGINRQFHGSRILLLRYFETFEKIQPFALPGLMIPDGEAALPRLALFVQTKECFPIPNLADTVPRLTILVTAFAQLLSICVPSYPLAVAAPSDISH